MEKKNSWGEALRFGLILIAVIIPFRMYVAQPFIVHGASMDDTFHQSDYLIVDELSYLLRDPKRGEVIVFKNPFNQSQYFIKRIIGLPGETVILKEGKVTIISGNQTIKLEENYLGSDSTENKRVKLEAGQYFAMGDNRSVSFDSRNWGPLSRDLIRGRALLRLFPFDEISYLPGHFTYNSLNN